MKKVILLFTAVLLLGGAHLILTMAPDAVITVKSVSPQEADDQGLPSRATGLHVVGVGSLTYLSAMEAAGEEVMSYEWTLAGPAGSAATLDVTDPSMVTFRPDLEGQYTATVTITTASGSASVSKVITAAMFVGVGNVGGLIPNVAAGQCAFCHMGNTTQWGETGHASMLERGLEGTLSDHYGESCISCHTVGYDTDPEAVNGGFDDVAAAEGWTFPATPQAGEWDNLVNNFPAVAHKANIQCESCHGPGSLHKGNVANIEVSMSAGVCAYCHDSGSHHFYPDAWKNSGHAAGNLNYSGRTPCQDCHSAWGYVARMDPVSDLHPSAEQMAEDRFISCQTCHDPHSAANEFQLRSLDDVELVNGFTVTKGGTGKLCMTCHHARNNGPEFSKVWSSRFDPHHGPQADMLFGTNVPTFGRYIPNSLHKDVLENTCVSCHMAEMPSDIPYGDPNWGKVGSHSFNVAKDGIDNVEVCAACHGEIESFEDIMAREDYDGDGAIEGAMAELEGLMEELAMLLPPVGEPTIDIQQLRDADQAELAATYNYNFIEEDKSKGMHNFQFAIGLMKVSIEAVTNGVLSPGSIISVMDVPNDQGKQVAVNWTRFGGDGVSVDPIEVYNVWRLVDMAAKAPEGKITTLDKVPVDKPAAKTMIELDGEVWTAVGSQPAAMMDSYSAVVPTLADSTADGVVWSTFMVTGHTATSTVYVSSEPMQGYSIDNLAPTVPAGLDAKRDGDVITLTWQNGEDTQYTEVYRSTEPGFDPAGMDPVARVAEESFTEMAGVSDYYYVVVAYDFAGNRGEYSPELTPRIVTGLEAGSEIPEAYALRPNYPNPFNPSTQIEFSVPEATDVRITVFDVSGKEVDVLVDSHVGAGTYQLTWQAEHLASGVYFYRMETASYVKTQTMLLLK
jgi:hypothetical protein